MPLPFLAPFLMKFGGDLIQGAGSALGGYAQGKAMSEQAKAQREQNQMQSRQNWQQMGMNDRQFGQNANLQRSQYLDQRAVGAADLQKRLAGVPMADRAMYMMTQRAGQTPGAFQARDYTRGGMPGAGQAQGGYAPVLQAQQASAAQYTPGAGGMSAAPLQDAMARLQSMAGVPGQYNPTDVGTMQMQGLANQLREQAAMATKDKDRQKYEARLEQMLGMYPQARG
jgi:hypothetical protein